MRKVTLFAFAACLALAACARKPSSEQSSEAVASASAASAAASASAAAEVAPMPLEPKPLEIGPAPVGDTSVTVESRRQAVLDLLYGGAKASQLARDATEPGVKFNPALRDVVAPAVYVRSPRMRLGGFTITGDLGGTSVVQQMVRQRFGTARQCYQDELARNPKAEGSVVLRFQIDKNGNVKQLSAKTFDLIPKSMGDCVKQVLSKVVFPKPQSAVEVVAPIYFEPG